MNFAPFWGQMQGGYPQQQPVVFIPQPSVPNNTPQPQSWAEVVKIAKKEAKREAKLKDKWNKDLEEKKKKETPKPKVPIDLVALGVLLSPIIGYPTLLFYQKLFAMWGSALGLK